MVKCSALSLYSQYAAVYTVESTTMQSKLRNSNVIRNGMLLGRDSLVNSTTQYVFCYKSIFMFLIPMMPQFSFHIKEDHNIIVILRTIYFYPFSVLPFFYYIMYLLSFDRENERGGLSLVPFFCFLLQKLHKFIHANIYISFINSIQR